jgi:hypothetical protein
MTEHACNTRIRADAYFAFMTQGHHSSSIPMPFPLIFHKGIGSQLARARNSSHFGAVMLKDQSQENHGNPYSPLMCILLLFILVAATQLNVLASWF